MEMKRFLAVFLMAVLLTAGCGVQMPGGETTDAEGFFTLPSHFSVPTTQPTEPEVPGTTAQQVYWEPEDLVGTWISSHTEVEGDVNYNDSATVQILVADNGEYRMWYMDREFPRQNFDDVRLRVEASDTFGYFEDCVWLAVVEYTDPMGVSRTLSLTSDGLLVIRDQWEMDGAPMVGYRWYRRAE